MKTATKHELVGRRVRVYQKPITREDFEDVATVVSIDHEDNYEVGGEVEFDDGDRCWRIMAKPIELAD